MVKKTLLALAVILLGLVVAFVVVVAMQPTDFTIARSASMAAPVEEVFAQVNDFHHWEAWSPWLELDPNAKATFEGPDAGEGAVFRWAGNQEIGEGSMTILQSVPPEVIRIRLDFVKPFEDTALTEFTFRPEGDGTAVTWTMSGQNNFIGKAFCLFIDLDKMVGGKYEEALANIKAVVESQAGQ